MDDATLRACLSERWGDAGQRLGADMPAEMVALTFALAIDQMETEADPAFAPFASRAIIEAHTAHVIGHFRFHSRPDADYLRQWGPGGIEVGYGLFAPWQSQGYGTEMLKAITQWARAQDIRYVIAAVALGNIASERLLARFGFDIVGETTAPSGQVEAVYRLSLS